MYKLKNFKRRNCRIVNGTSNADQSSLRINGESEKEKTLIIWSLKLSVVS